MEKSADFTTVTAPAANQCPITGLPIVRRAEWNDIRISDHYSVSFQLIGDTILFSTPRGSCTGKDMEQYGIVRESILTQTGLRQRRFVEIKDYQFIEGRASREGRQQFTQLMKAERERNDLLGFIALNASLYIQVAFRVGMKLHSAPFPVIVAATYREALYDALRIININENDCIRRTKPEWLVETATFRTLWYTIGTDILFCETGGILDENVTPRIIGLAGQILKEVRDRTEKIYFIVNCEGLRKITLKARNALVDTIKQASSTTANFQIFMFGTNPMVEKMVVISKPFFPFPVLSVKNFEESMQLIFQKKSETNIHQFMTPVGAHPSPSRSYSHEEVQSQVTRLLQIMSSVNWDSHGIEYDHTLIDDDNPFKPVYESISLIKQDFDDILEERNKANQTLRENEELFRIMFEGSHDYMAICDSRFSIIWINKAWNSLLESYITRVEDIFDHIHLEDRARVRESWSDMASNSRDLTNVEFRFTRKDGAIAYVEMSVRVMGSTSGVLMFLICHDISARVNAQNEKYRYEEQLRQIDKMQAIGQLAGGIAHDFNNQLAGIMGYADLILSRIETDKHLYPYAEKIVKISERVGDLISKLLAFARKGKYNSVNLNLNDIIRDVIALLVHTLDKKIVIRKNSPKDRPIIKGDNSQIQNALLNIALNARDAMPMGGELTFTTTVSLFDEERCQKYPYKVLPGRYVCVCIRDTGVGMDENVMKHIFEPFFTTKEHGKGSGMGLAAVYGTIKNHGGVIEVESKPKSGTSFLLYLPLVDSNPDIIPEEIESKSPAQLENTCHGTILVVDDEDIVLDITSEALSEQGYTVITSNDSIKAVQCYEKAWKSIDLVILDLVMPGFGGYDTFVAMKSINPDLRLIVSSGYSADGEASQILSTGKYWFLQKPYSVNELCRRVRDALTGEPKTTQPQLQPTT